MFRRGASFPVQPHPPCCQPNDSRHAAKLDRQLRMVKHQWARNLAAPDPARWSAIPAPEPESFSSALQRGELRDRDRREAHVVADGEKAHGLAIRPEHGEGSAPDQSPAAGRRKWVHAGLIASDSDAAWRRAAARAIEPGRRQGVRQFTEIREPRNESKKVNGVGQRSVQFDCLGGGQWVQAGDFVQIWTKLAAITRGNFQFPPFRDTHGVKPLDIATPAWKKFCVAISSGLSPSLFPNGGYWQI